MNGIAKMMMLRNNTRDDRREDMPESRRQRDNRGRYMEDDDRPEMRRYDGDYAPESRRRRDSRGRYMEGDDGPEMRGRYDNGNPGMDGRDMPESRFRDRRGREHYDDGRFAPMRSDGRIEWEDYPRDNGYPQAMYPRIPPYMPRQEDMPDRPAGLIGFMGQEDREEQPHMRHGREMQNAGHMDRGMADTMEMMDLDQVTAEAWARSLPKEDASGNIVGKGPHWTKEQIKPYMAQAGYTGPEHKFYALMNALYSDYCKLAKKYGHDRPEYYADMAKLWLEDKDAWPEKAGLYYKYIVKH